MNTLRQFFKDYLNFTMRERYGIAGLLFLIALFYFLPILLYSKPDYSKELRQFQSQIRALDSQGTDTRSSFAKNENVIADPITPFPFDPNTVDPVALRKFGLPDFIIRRFTRFRNAGARFYKKEDLKKIYGLKAEWYQRMEPFVVIGEERKTQPSANVYEPRKTVEKVPLRVELNSADSVDLISINGIGPFVGSRILKYRKALGGFVDIDQLYEIYGLKREQVDGFKNQLWVDPGMISPLNLNTADYTQLNAHPYLSGKEANAIIRYRQQHGLFTTVEDLLKIYSFPRETLDKVKPYLMF